MPELSLFLYSYGLGAIFVIGFNVVMRKKSNRTNALMPFSKGINEVREMQDELTDKQKKISAIIFNVSVIGLFLAMPFLIHMQ